MAWSVTDHGTSNNASGATLTKATAANVTAGSLIVVAVYDKSNAASGGSMTDDAGNTYTAVGATNPNGATTNGICQFFYSILSTQLNSGQNVTYTKQTSGVGCAMSVLSATGGASSSILDSSVTATNTTGSAAAPTSLTSGTPSVSGELFVAMSGTTSTNPTLTTDSGNGWAVPPDASADAFNYNLIGGNQTNAGTGTIAWHPSANKNGLWASIIIGFKPNAGNTYNVSITESGTASETETVTAAFASSITESGTATETESVTAIFAATITESGSAADAPSATYITNASITEAGSAIEVESVRVNFASSITEVATATETESARVNFVSSITETATATDLESVLAAFAASCIEVANATDTENTDIDQANLAQPAAVRMLWDRDSFGRFIPGYGVNHIR